MIRVAMVAQSFSPVLGGAQRQIQRLGPLLAERGVVTSVVTRRPPDTPLRERQPGLQVCRIPVLGGRSGGSLSYTAGGTAVLTRLRPDVIHAHDLLSPSSIALVAGTALRVPVVAKVLSTGKGGDIDRLLTKPLGGERLRLMARRFAAFVGLSAEIEEELIDHGVASGKIHRIPNGVDVERFRPADSAERYALRRSLGVRTDAPLAVYAGRFAPVKRLDVLLEAFKQAPGQLLLAGDGSEGRRVRALAQHPDLVGRVHVRDTVEDPVPLYRAADVYITASTTEGMSGSVLEAMAAGLPVVAARASGMSELVRPDTGVLASDDGPAALAGAVTTLAESPERRRSLGAAGRRLVESRFSLDATADRLVELYGTVTDGYRD